MSESSCDHYKKHLPQFLQNTERVIFTKIIKIRSDNEFVAVITRNGIYFELWNKEILRECCLNSSEDELSGDVTMDIFYLYSGESGRQVFYLIKIGEKLFVVKRKNDTLNLVRRECGVVSARVADKSGRGNATVVITKTDGSRIESNFNDENLTENEESQEPSIFLLGYLETHNRKLECGLEMRGNVVRKELHKMRHVTKYGPPEMHDGAPDEASPLVKYGEVWVKFHNDRIILGIPVFNTTYTRRRVVLNIRPMLANTQLNCLNYQFRLYRIRNDSCTFDNVTEFFDVEEPSYANSLDFDNDWTPQEESNLLPGLSAILVVTTDIMDFSSASVFNWCVYVQYEIKHDGKVVPLQLFAGKVEITPKIFFEPLFSVEHEDKNYLYRNLLAIASTSSYRMVHIESVGSVISRRLYRFLIDDLKFQRVPEFLELSSVNDTAMELMPHHELETQVGLDDVEMREANDSYFMISDTNQKRPTAMFYHGNDGFWKGALIRICEINKIKLKLKIYMRTGNHVACFLQAIRLDFGTEVILSTDSDVDDSFKCLRSFLDEVTCKRQLLRILEESQKDSFKTKESLEKVFRSEFKTDSIFARINK